VIFVNFSVRGVPPTDENDCDSFVTVAFVVVLEAAPPPDELEVVVLVVVVVVQDVFPVIVSVCAFVLSPRPNTTVFVPVKHDECVIVHASDFVVPAETVVPELDVGSPLMERLPEA